MNNPELRTILPPDAWKGTPVAANGRFTNIHPFDIHFTDVLKWKMGRNPYKAEKQQEKWAPQIVTDDSWIDSVYDCIVWLGHATFFIRLHGCEMITDPVFGNISLIKRKTQLPVDPQRFRSLDYVLLSHDHRDHFDKDSLRLLAGNNPHVKYLSGLGNETLIHKTTHATNIETAGWYQQFRTGENDPAIYYLPSRHWGRRGAFDTNKRLWGAFVIRTADHCIYFGGDSGYDTHFKDAQRIFGEFDYAILGIGAYEPVWFMHNVHMGPTEAIQAGKDLKAKHIIPMHYGTFDLSDEPLGKPLAVLLEHAQKESILPLKPGEVLRPDQPFSLAR